MFVMSEDHEISSIRPQIVRNHVTLEKEAPFIDSLRLGSS